MSSIHTIPYKNSILTFVLRTVRKRQILFKEFKNRKIRRRKEEKNTDHKWKHHLHNNLVVFASFMPRDCLFLPLIYYAHWMNSVLKIQRTVITIVHSTSIITKRKWSVWWSANSVQNKYIMLDFEVLHSILCLNEFFFDPLSFDMLFLLFFSLSTHSQSYFMHFIEWMQHKKNGKRVFKTKRTV